MWFMLGAMAVQAAGNFATERGNAKVSQINLNANAKVSNMAREAQNLLSSAQGNLARYSQVRDNKARAKNAESSLDATNTNFFRAMGQISSGTLEQRIQGAEEAGALRARMGALGVGGATQQMINATNNLRQARIQEMTATRVDQMTADIREVNRSYLPALMLGMDNLQIVDEMNFQRYLAPQVPKPSLGQHVTGFVINAAEAYAKYGVEFKQKDPTT